MREQEIKNFSEKELKRVFKDTISPIINLRGARRLIEDGLTIESLYSEKGKALKTVEIFQTEKHGFTFFGYDSIKSFLGDVDFNQDTPELEYKVVFETQLVLDKDNNSALNEIYEIFNLNHPENYLGKIRSLSVSDIVKLDNKFYFVDSIGCKRLEYNC